MILRFLFSLDDIHIVIVFHLYVSLVEVNWDVEIDLQMWPPSGHHPRQDCEGEAIYCALLSRLILIASHNFGEIIYA